MFKKTLIKKNVFAILGTEQLNAGKVYTLVVTVVNMTKAGVSYGGVLSNC